MSPLIGIRELDFCPGSVFVRNMLLSDSEDNEQIPMNKPNPLGRKSILLPIAIKPHEISPTCNRLEMLKPREV